MELFHFTCLKWEKHIPTHWAIFPVLVVSQWDPILVWHNKKNHVGHRLLQVGSHKLCCSFVLVHKCWVWRSSRLINLAIEILRESFHWYLSTMGFSYLFVCHLWWCGFSQPLVRPRLNLLGKNAPRKLEVVQVCFPYKLANQVVQLNGSTSWYTWISPDCWMVIPRLWQIKWSFSQLLLASISLFWGAFSSTKGVKCLTETKSFPTHLKKTCLSK